MLNKLTSEQEKLMPVIRDEWIQFCLGGDNSINKEMATKGLRWIYGLAKLDSPRVVFVDGPFACQFAVWLIEELAKKKAVPKNDLNSVGASVWDSVRDSVWDSVRDSVGDSVRASVWDSVRAMKKQPASYGWCDLGGDAGWLSWVDYFERIGIKVHENFYSYKDYVKAGVFMTIFLRGFAIVCPRPSVVNKDERGRLHNADGPAAEWKGEKYWFWHGTRVNEKIIMRPSELTAEEISNEKNSEVSRAIAEKLGWDCYMQILGTVLIDKWFDPSQTLHYELYDFKDRKFSLMPRLLKMESPELNDGTRPSYIEPVDPKLQTCQAARKWQFLKDDGSWPSVEECNKDSNLHFLWEA